MFARHRFEQGDRVLVVPLHLIDDPQADFAKELDKFCSQVPDLPTGLLHDDTAPDQLLLVLDGLDELAKQGAAGAAVAQAFVEAVEKTVQRRNTEGVQTQDDGPRLRVLISGRPLAVQSVSNSFRAEGRVLEFLPYWVDEDHRKEGEENNRRFRFTGQTSLLDDDQRKEWWSNYGDLCGESYGGLPEPLTRDQFREITAQPLHNFLIAMVYRSPEGPAGDGDNQQSAIDFSGEVSLNEIYAHLLEKVYERSWGDAEGHVATKNVITLRGFRRLFQEMALAAWHHRERVTTIKAVEARCTTEQLKKVLTAYREEFTDGVAQLFAAFYVRGSDRLIDNEKTFEFTHKSFGEFLTACGIVGTLSRIARKLTPKDNEEDEDEIDPWDERKALNTWLKLCGPTAITFDLQKYLSNEVAICYASEGGPERVASWRRTLGKMIDQMLATGMPAEKLQGLKFIEMDERARHAESALLILHACCVNAELADSERKFEPTEIRWPGNAAAAIWLRRICPQPDSWNSRLLILQSLTGLSLQNQNLLGLWLVWANLSEANLRGANLRGATITKSQLRSAVGTPRTKP